jgi:tagaturonate epimerase
MKLEKYSFGVGDRFAHQAKAQLNAMIEAEKVGIDVVPVWNKSCREHTTIKSEPAQVRKQADEAVEHLGWKKSYYVDADHINITNVEGFIEASNFFTLDVADYIGKKAAQEDIDEFAKRHKNLVGSLKIDGISRDIVITEEIIKQIASKILLAVQQAGRLYRHIEASKGKGTFITEVSMDETELAQNPLEMLFILAAIADEGIPAQTIAPKFTGRFNKGVDYVGDVALFEKEFRQDLAVIRYAVGEFGLEDNLKLSIHSGSDKFSIYAPINRAIKEFDAGLHVKTAGTTWLEEIIGLAAAGGEGLEIAKKIYARSYERFEELCNPYATVIDIDKQKLPAIDEVQGWDCQRFKQAVAHRRQCDNYNPDMRQLLHVGYKVAAEMGAEYTNALEKYEDIIAEHVTENIFKRHIIPILK